MHEQGFFLEPFEDEAALVDLPGISALETLLQEPLDVVGQDMTYAAFESTPYPAAAPPKLQSTPSLDSEVSSTGAAPPCSQGHPLPSDQPNEEV